MVRFWHQNAIVFVQIGQEAQAQLAAMTRLFSEGMSVFDRVTLYVHGIAELEGREPCSGAVRQSF